MNRSRWLGWLCVLATFPLYGCDDNDPRRSDGRRNPVGPSPISFNGSQQSAVSAFSVVTHGVTLQPELAVPDVTTTRNGCQARPAFQLPFTLVGSGLGRSDVSIYEIRSQFVDRAGIVGGATTIAGSELDARFGNTRLPPVGNRSFPMTLSFGCTGSAVGTLNISVLSGESRDRPTRTSLSIDVR